MKSGVFFAVMLTAGLLSVASTAHATPITYTESAIGSGNLDGTAFTDQTVTITVSGDTSGVFLSSGAFFNNATTTVSVSGVGSDTFTDVVGAFDYSGVPWAGIDDYTQSTFIILTTSDPAFGSYDLTTPIGPITNTSTINASLSFPTLGGSFQISSVGADSTFTASTVPEPASMVLLGTGLLGLASRRRKSVRP